MDENAKKGLVKTVEKALNQEQARFTKIRNAVDDEVKQKADFDYQLCKLTTEGNASIRNTIKGKPETSADAYGTAEFG